MRTFLSILVSLLLLILIFAYKLEGYTGETHRLITYQAVTYLWNEGLFQGAFPISIVGNGAVEEDVPMLRSYFHYDPMLDSTYAWANCDAIDWAFSSSDTECRASWVAHDPDGDRIVTDTLTNNFNWQNAVHGNDYNGRWSALGHVLHLLEDMAVPAHTRKDPHPFDEPLEDYANGVIPLLPSGQGLITFSKPWELFEKLERHTQENYFSGDTCFHPDFPGPIARDEDNNYFYDADRNSGGRRIAHRSMAYRLSCWVSCNRRLCTIDDTIAQEQFQELGPRAVQYVASLVRHYFDIMYRPRVVTFHQNDNTYSVSLMFEGTQDVSSVTVSGPAGSGISNAPLYDDGQHVDEEPNDGIFSNHLVYLPTRPSIGDVYAFSFTENGFPFHQKAGITGIVDLFANLISPSGRIVTITPTFHWTPAPSASNIDSQQIIVFKNGQDGAAWVPNPSRWIWWQELDLGTSSVIYNNDGTAKEDLVSGGTYYWQICTLDGYRNRSCTYQKKFTIGEKVLSWLSFVEGNPGIPGDGVFINTVGGGYPWGCSFGCYPDERTFTLSTAISLSQFTEGFTVIAFLSPADIQNATGPMLSFVKRSDPCRGLLSGLSTTGSHPEKITINNVEGVVARVSQWAIEWVIGLANQHYPDCNVTADNFFVGDIIVADTSGDGQGNITSLDAAIILPGQNAVP